VIGGVSACVWVQFVSEFRSNSVHARKSEIATPKCARERGSSKALVGQAQEKYSKRKMLLFWPHEHTYILLYNFIGDLGFLGKESGIPLVTRPSLIQRNLTAFLYKTMHQKKHKPCRLKVSFPSKHPLSNSGPEPYASDYYSLITHPNKKIILSGARSWLVSPTRETLLVFAVAFRIYVLLFVG